MFDLLELMTLFMHFTPGLIIARNLGEAWNLVILYHASSPWNLVILYHA